MEPLISGPGPTVASSKWFLVVEHIRYDVGPDTFDYFGLTCQLANAGSGPLQTINLRRSTARSGRHAASNCVSSPMYMRSSREKQHRAPSTITSVAGATRKWR